MSNDLSGVRSSSGTFDYFAFQKAIQARFAELTAQVEELGQKYRAGHPFPHIVLDRFLPEWVAEEIHAEFPSRDSQVWTKLPTEDQRGKYALTDDTKMPLKLRALIQELNSGYFLRFLEKLTGIPDLISDTKMVGGGLHMIETGGKLSVHVDFSHHPSNGLHRRINFLLYLNKDWKEEFGGHFELWDKDIQRAVTRILPVFNRAAMFSTSSTSYHGHPEPMSCPEHITRKSVALYYFSKAREDGDVVEHNTLFKSRPQDRFNLGNVLLRMASSGTMRDLIPPVLYKGLRRLWNRKFTGA